MTRPAWSHRQAVRPRCRGLVAAGLAEALALPTAFYAHRARPARLDRTRHAAESRHDPGRSPRRPRPHTGRPPAPGSPFVSFAESVSGDMHLGSWGSTRMKPTSPPSRRGSLLSPPETVHGVTRTAPKRGRHPRRVHLPQPRGGDRASPQWRRNPATAAAGRHREAIPVTFQCGCSPEPETASSFNATARSGRSGAA